MAAHKLYSISFCTSSLRPFVFDNAMSELGDWVRFNAVQWYLWTDKDKRQVVDEISTWLVGTEQFVVVVVQSEEAAGQAPEWFWKWLNDKMLRQYQGVS